MSPVNQTFITKACQTALDGINAIDAAAINASKWSYFGTVLTQADFINQYSSLTPALIGAAIASIAAIQGVLTANGNAFKSALTKIGRSPSNNPGFGIGVGRTNGAPSINLSAQQIQLGAKPANAAFVASVVATALAGVNAISAAIVVAQDYATYYQTSLTQGDFSGNYNDLSPADIGAAMAAVAAVQGVLTANSNTLMNALLAIAA